MGGEGGDEIQERMKSLVYTVVIDTMQEEKVRRGRKRSYDNKQHHLPTRTEHIPNNPK